METRHCYECDRDLNLTVNYFAEVVSNSPPFDEICKRCRKKKKRLARQAKLRNLPTILEKIQCLGIDLLGREVIDTGNNVPHSAELLEGIMSAFGGVESFGRIFAAHFWQSEPGKAQRTRMLQIVTGLAIRNVDQGGAKKPLDLWTTEDLQSELDRQLASAAQQLRITHTERHAESA